MSISFPTAAKFELKWIVATLLGMLAGISAGHWIVDLMFPRVGITNYVGSPLFWLAFGLLMGLGQWVVMGTRVSGVSGWVLATGAGLFAASLAVKLLNGIGSIALALRAYPLLADLLAGIALGLLQYQVLKRKIASARWWIPGTALCWTLANVPIGPNPLFLQYFRLLFFAALTGFVIERLLRESSAGAPATRASSPHSDLPPNIPA